MTRRVANDRRTGIAVVAAGALVVGLTALFTTANIGPPQGNTANSASDHTVGQVPQILPPPPDDDVTPPPPQPPPPNR